MFCEARNVAKRKSKSDNPANCREYGPCWLSRDHENLWPNTSAPIRLPPCPGGASPSAAEECLNKNDIIFANRPRTMAGKYLGNDYTSLATTSYGDHWRIMRRISSMEILSTQRLQMLQSIRTDEVKAMIRRLYRASETQQAVDMKIVFFELMINVMMRMISGKSYYGENVEEIEEAKKFREIVIETFQLGGTSNMADFLPMLRWLGVGGVEKRLMVLQKKRDASMQELVEECKRRMRSNNGGDLDMGGKNKTMIEVLLTLQEKEPEYYTDGIIGILMLVSSLIPLNFFC
ncbi:Cytochrome [Abeliophyllum distichum]|uniref:Cytochrome n=1 Tax=Abeliophyllum distichum TaxID=126358 RepID=A0ABD1Q905_9LAMI